MIRGNIVKISNGTIKETASQDYTAFANNIHTNAGKKILENSNDGVVFGEPAKMTTKEDRVNVTVGLFFDGTGNNRNNIDRKTDKNSTVYHDKTTGWKWKWQDDTSYKNDRTNVDHLEKMYKTENLYFSIYIEGIGTTNDEYDSVPEMGTGTGSTGIRGKVRNACEDLVDKLKRRTKKDIHLLTVDVFGFSRGAAAARNFVHEITKASYKARPGSGEDVNLYDDDGKVVNKEDLPARGHFGLKSEGKLKVNNVSIRFAGLYDTVSAYGIVHSNDVTQLNLNAVNKAAKIVHLTAADEHRAKFELTSVSTGIELALPGVHSDVGGSYTDQTEEKVSLAEEMLSVVNRTEIINRERNRLISQGWYKADQMSNKHPYKLVGTRILSNKYSLIPLHLMFEMGKDTCHFKEDQINSGLYKIPEAPLKNSSLSLTEVYKRIRAYAILKTAPPLDFNDPGQLRSLKNMLDHGVYSVDKYNTAVKDHYMLMELRNRYLHFSSSWDGIGKEPEINKKGERERTVFNPRLT